MLTLYGCAGTGSACPQAILAYAGVEHRMVMLDVGAKEQHKPEYLQMNPRGQVPWLVTEQNEVITESLAISLHLADTLPDAHLIGPIGTLERANTYKWMSYLATNIYEGVLRSEYSDRYTTTDAAGVKAKANIDMMQWWSIVDQALTSGKLLVGDRIGVADIYMAMLTAWFEDRERLFTECRRLKSAVDIVLSESAIHDVFVANELV